MNKSRYVYVIRCKVTFKDGSHKDYEYIDSVHSSLRKALDYLNFRKVMFIDIFTELGYDIERDAKHWVDFRKDGYHSFINIMNDVNLTTYAISKEILY